MSQWPTRLVNIGVRVSPRPRSAPVVTTCRPSNSWKAAATRISITPVATTAGSSVNSRTSGSAPTMKSSAETDMNPSASAMTAPPALAALLDRAATDGMPDTDGAGRRQARAAP